MFASNTHRRDGPNNRRKEFTLQEEEDGERETRVGGAKGFQSVSELCTQCTHEARKMDGRDKIKKEEIVPVSESELTTNSRNNGSADAHVTSLSDKTSACCLSSTRSTSRFLIYNDV